jgi:hypothetical protein
VAARRAGLSIGIWFGTLEAQDPRPGRLAGRGCQGGDDRACTLWLALRYQPRAPGLVARDSATRGLCQAGNRLACWLETTYPP